MNVQKQSFITTLTEKDMRLYDFYCLELAKFLRVTEDELHLIFGERLFDVVRNFANQYQSW